MTGQLSCFENLEAIPKSNTDNELRQAAISLLDKGRGRDITVSEEWFVRDFGPQWVQVKFNIPRG